MIDQARVASPTDAAPIYQKIGQRVLDLAWFVPLYRDEAIDAANSKTNVTYTPEVGQPLIQNYSPKD